jgi:competence protein ComEC
MSLPVSIKEVPFFRLIIPFLAGIACQYWLAILPFSWWNYAIILFLLVAVFTCFFVASYWPLRWSFGLALNVFLFFSGILLTIKQPVTDKLLVSSSNRAIIYLLDNPQLRTKSIRVEAEVRYLLFNSNWRTTNEKMLIYFDVRDSLVPYLSYGSVLAVNIAPQPVPRSGNPFQFDYKRYLSDRGVCYTAFIKPANWIRIGNEGVWIKKKALLLRDKLVLMFQANGLTGDELAVASALTLGYQDLLDDELRHVYSSSGAMHILSVSGLHVGILYVLFSYLLSFLDKRVLTRAIKAMVLLVFLWFFALLTGLPPCVQRSALMFSFLVVSDFFNRKSNIYNTLAASAFVLLVINPYNLLDIGFQLSYLAVVSIVFFYPYLYRLIYVESWVLDKAWSLVAVSIAAQFGTFSICLFYFNQFPNYFLLANLIAIPLSTIALYLSVFLIIVSPFTVIAGYAGKAFSFTVGLLNHGLEYVEKLPYSVSEGIHITALQMFVAIGVILALSFYLVTKRFRYISATLLLIIVFLSLNLDADIQRANTKEFVVFNIGTKSLMSFRSGNSIIFL